MASFTRLGFAPGELRGRLSQAQITQADFLQPQRTRPTCSSPKKEPRISIDHQAKHIRDGLFAISHLKGLASKRASWHVGHGL